MNTRKDKIESIKALLKGQDPFSGKPKKVECMVVKHLDTIQYLGGEFSGLEISLSEYNQLERLSKSESTKILKSKMQLSK